ncbi:MAG: UDP-N-acetylmuramoyl-L-alanine--D-glutamate ligase [bacterium]
MSILILGYGKTGKAVYNYIGGQSKLSAANASNTANNGGRIFVYDDIMTDAEISALNRSLLPSGKSPVFFNKNGEEVFFREYFMEITQCIASPGIERNHNVISKLKKHNIPVYSEIEFAYKESAKASKIIAITGTNGKTTTATLCESAVNKAGLSGKTFVGGNLGVPFISGVRDFNDFILEISSFQLEWIYDFKPDIAVLLNVKDDHLDRYENFDEYRLTKYKLFKNLRHSDVAVLNYDDYNSAILKGVTGSNVILYGFEENKCDVYYKDDAVNLNLKHICGFDASVSLKNVKDKRRFVISDMMAAACSLMLYGISPDIIRTAFEEYELLKHRVEYIGNIGEIEFYDDSKATNPAAVISALQSFNETGKKNRDIVLILGGKDKGFNYECMIAPVKDNVRACVLIGETKNVLRETLIGYVELITAGDMFDAVRKSFNYLINDNKRTGLGTVLLSPASSSFDMFRDYNERGDIFKKCYIDLKDNLEIASDT